MSYILEALEKSEKERQDRKIPDLQTQHTVYPGMTRGRRGRRSGMRLRPAVIMALAFVFGVWLLRDHLPMELEIRVSRQPPLDNAKEAGVQEISTPSSPAEQLTIEAHAPSTADQQDSLSLKNDELTTSPSGDNDLIVDEIVRPRQETTASVREEPVVMREEIRLQPAPILLDRETDGENALIPLPYIDELPETIRRNLPSLKFAGHTFAEEPGRRLIIINNGINREGDMVEPGLRLKEITWNGVILEYRGVTFQVQATGL